MATTIDTSLKKLIVEGSIAAGKTTLCEYVAKKSNGRAVILPERVDEEFLKLFYSDKPGYAFSLQLYMLETRTNGNLLELLKIETQPKNGQPKPSIALLDRSVVGDFVFALTNYITGAIKEPEIRVYFSVAGGQGRNGDGDKLTVSGVGDAYKVLERIYGSDGDWSVLFLHSPSQACKQRVDEVRGTREKDVLEAWYYETLEQVYFNVMLQLRHRYGWRVCVSPWSHYAAQTHIYDDMVTLAESGNGSGSEHSDNDDADDESQPPKVSMKVDGAICVLNGHTTTLSTPPKQVDVKRARAIGITWYSQASRERALESWSLNQSAAATRAPASTIDGTTDAEPSAADK